LIVDPTTTILDPAIVFAPEAEQYVPIQRGFRCGGISLQDG
jgi:hypothetical protein